LRRSIHSAKSGSITVRKAIPRLTATAEIELVDGKHVVLELAFSQGLEAGGVGLARTRATVDVTQSGCSPSPRSDQGHGVARLVVDRRTNPEIAAELFLSQKTVETHLRNIFRKVDVSSRVELARAVERADYAGPAVT
jgi:DNA-binding NarL/FixJ family response regulator